MRVLRGVLAGGVGLVCASVGACGPTYGSKTIVASVDVEPERAPVYVIPQDVWVKNGGEKMLKDPGALAGHRVGVSPVSDELKENRRYVFVAERDGRFTWLEQTVTKQNKAFLLKFLE